MFTASVTCGDLDFSSPKDAAMHLVSVVSFARPMTVEVINQHTGAKASIKLGEGDILREEPPSTFAERAAWAKSLTDEQLTAALYEMRERGAAVAYYDAAELATMFDDGRKFDAFIAEERSGLEEAMCDAARAYVSENGPPIEFDDEGEDDE